MEESRLTDLRRYFEEHPGRMREKVLLESLARR